MPSKPRVIYWFRTDLRLHDSPALKAALDLNPECLYPIWTWDPHYVYRARVGPNRWQFLYALSSTLTPTVTNTSDNVDCQNDLSSSITKLNKNSKLFLIREAPQTLFPKLFKAWKISHLVFEKDTDAYAKDRDTEVVKLAKEAGVEVIIKMGRTLWDPDELVKLNGGKPTMTISQVQNVPIAAKKIGEPARPVPTPKSFPSPGNTDLSSIDHVRPLSTPDLNAQYRSSKESSYTSIAGPRNDFAVPTLAELGIPEATTPHRGGENIALKTLDAIIQNEDYTATFEKPNTAPTAFNPQSTTLLSPHHHFGSLSVREVYWRVREVLVAYKKKKKTPSQPPTSLIGQLQFRDMYFGAQTQLGYAFAQCTTNSSCRFLDWHLPSTLDPKTNLLDGKHTIDSLEAEAWLHRWRNGITGFPWIDGLMRQLRDEGWIHHLGRHAVACFLTRGGCYIHWERGAEVFEEWLIDHETACNAGNWQWLSCTAFFAQFYRCYSPIKFPQKWDKNGDFVRHYVPELVKFDTKYIYEPWKAPIADQKKWGCMIKGDGSTTEEDGKKVYPKPMLDFDERRDICMGAMKKGYGIRMYGDDPKVLDGSWREIFGVVEGKEAAWNGIDENGAGEKRKRRGTGREDEDTAEDDGFEKAHEDAEKLARKGQKTHFNRAMNGQGTLDAMVSRTNAKH